MNGDVHLSKDENNEEKNVSIEVCPKCGGVIKIVRVGAEGRFESLRALGFRLCDCAGSLID
jgi:formate dehydrogenase maturation protein FdhE